MILVMGGRPHIYFSIVNGEIKIKTFANGPALETFVIVGFKLLNALSFSSIARKE